MRDDPRKRDTQLAAALRSARRCSAAATMALRMSSRRRSSAFDWNVLGFREGPEVLGRLDFLEPLDQPVAALLRKHDDGREEIRIEVFRAGMTSRDLGRGVGLSASLVRARNVIRHVPDEHAVDGLGQRLGEPLRRRIVERCLTPDMRAESCASYRRARAVCLCS